MSHARNETFQDHRQVGCDGLRIDLALVDPAHPCRYVPGVECDGWAYHGSATARDRVRLRQQIHEDLGWRICRIWSTDWFRDPDGQVDRVLAAYERAMEQVGRPAPPPDPEEPEGPHPRPGDNPGRPRIWRPECTCRDIDEVPPSVIRELVLDSLRRYGATRFDLAVERPRPTGANLVLPTRPAPGYCYR